MPDPLNLTNPWLVAVWPGMGHVALNAGIYLLSKLDMSVVAELDAGDLFDVDQVEVKSGLIQAGKPPRNRFFLWKDPAKRHDLVLFLGEAQPPVGKYAFCRHIIKYAREHGVERVITFAAMATQMRPDDRARVFGAATDDDSLAELKRLELTILDDGNIGGLNGVLLGAAAAAGVRGSCLLGEMPHVFAQLAFPKASLAILEVFALMFGLDDLDLGPLTELARTSEEQLNELLSRVEKAYKTTRGNDDDEDEEDGDEDEEDGPPPEAVEEEGISDDDAGRIEDLFAEAAKDRSKAFALKHELDRLGVFKQYEDRFLDLFIRPET